MLFSSKINDNCFKGGHPRFTEMAILQVDPVTILLASRNELFSFGTLALTKRNNLKSLGIVAFFSKLNEGTSRVSTCTEHEDERSLNIGVLIDYIHSCCWRFNEELAHFFYDIVLESEEQFLWSESFEDIESCEIIKFLRPIKRKRCCVRFGTSSPLLPSGPLSHN